MQQKIALSYRKVLKITHTGTILVDSQLRYADVVWGSLSRTKLAALQGLQTRALKIIRNAKIKGT